MTSVTRYKLYGAAGGFLVCRPDSEGITTILTGAEHQQGGGGWQQTRTDTQKQLILQPQQLPQSQRNILKNCRSTGGRKIWGNSRNSLIRWRKWECVSEDCVTWRTSAGWEDETQPWTHLPICLIFLLNLESCRKIKSCLWDKKNLRHSHIGLLLATKL